MAGISQTPIIQCAYQLTLELEKAASRFPKKTHYSLGALICQNAQVAFEKTIRANFVRDPGKRVDALSELNHEFFLLRLRLRMAKDLRVISVGMFGVLNTQIEDILVQLTKWKQWQQNQNSGS